MLYRKLRFRKAKKIICPAERPLRVLGDGRIENGRRVTATVFLSLNLIAYGVALVHGCRDDTAAVGVADVIEFCDFTLQGIVQ